MLSPGSYHLRVPKSPLKNLRFRQWLLKRCMEEKSYRRAVIEMCRQDIAFFISTFVWQFNPKKKNTAAVGPFILWDFQEAVLLDRPESVRMPEITKGMGVIWCYENDRSLVVQKSREMGISWLMLLVQDWLALFHPYFQSLNISRSADAVDDKSPNSLFWKLRFVHEYLPDWLKGEIKQEKMYLGYDRTKSVITGEASTGRAGVGGRAGVIFVDEFPLIFTQNERTVTLPTGIVSIAKNANASSADFWRPTMEGPMPGFIDDDTAQVVTYRAWWNVGFEPQGSIGTRMVDVEFSPAAC